MTKLNRDQLAEVLVQSEVKIAYTKKDGTARNVFATLKPSMIPEVTNPAPVKETHLTVFDTEKQQWRTLLVDQIGEITVGVPQKTLVGALA